MIKNSVACIVEIFLYNTGNAVLYYFLPFRQRKFHLNGKGIFLCISSPRKGSSMIFNDPSACLKTDLSALYLVLLLKNMVLEPGCAAYPGARRSESVMDTRDLHIFSDWTTDCP